MRKPRRVQNKKRVPIGAKEPHVKKLFKHMDAANISLNAASLKSGVAERVISNWRTGTSTPRLDLFVCVCQAVGLSISVQLELPL